MKTGSWPFAKEMNHQGFPKVKWGLTVPATNPAVAIPTTKNSLIVMIMNFLRWPKTILVMISSTASGRALGNPKHWRTCWQRIRATVGVPIALENGRGTMAVLTACVPRRMHSVIAESIFCSTSTTCAATILMLVFYACNKMRGWKYLNTSRSSYLRRDELCHQ